MAPDTEDAADAAQPGDAAEDSGYTVELEVAGDGTMTVSVESAGQESAESGGEDAAGTPVKSIKEALALILEIVKAGGQMPDTQGAEADFNAGYGDGAMEQGTGMAKNQMKFG